MTFVSQIVIVAAGGALGSLCRFAVAEFISLGVGASPLTAVFAINALGSFFAGMVASLLVGGNSSGLSLFLLVGFLGGFTTFSAFSLETIRLLEQGRYLQVAVSVFITPVVCLFACWRGYRCGAG
jgi:fluoride exporter